MVLYLNSFFTRLSWFILIWIKEKEPCRFSEFSLYGVLSFLIVHPENFICFGILEFPASSIQLRETTRLCLDTFSLFNGLCTFSRQYVRVIIGLTSFVFHISGKTILFIAAQCLENHCFICCVWIFFFYFSQESKSSSWHSVLARSHCIIVSPLLSFIYSYYTLVPQRPVLLIGAKRARRVGFSWNTVSVIPAIWRYTESPSYESFHSLEESVIKPDEAVWAPWGWRPQLMQFSISSTQKGK